MEQVDVGFRPAVEHVHAARTDHDGDLGLGRDLSALGGGDDDVVAFHDAARFRVDRVDADNGIRREVPGPGNVAQLGVAEHGHTVAGIEDDGILFHQFGRSVRTIGRLLKDGQRIHAVLTENLRGELHLAAGRGEAGLAVRAEQTKLIFFVVVLAAHRNRDAAGGGSLEVLIGDRRVNIEVFEGFLDAVDFGLRSAAKEVLGISESSADVAADAVVGTGFAEGFNNGLAQEKLAAEDRDRAAALKAHGGRQNHVEVVVGLGLDVEVCRYAEVHVLEGFLILRGARPHHEVGAEAERGTDGAGLDILGDEVELDGALLVGVGPDGTVLAVYPEVIQLGKQGVAAGEIKGHLPLVEIERLIGNGLAAGNVEGAGQRDEQLNGTPGVDAVLVVAVGGGALHNDGAAFLDAFHEHVDGGLDLLGGNVGDLGGLLDGELLHILLVLFKTVGPVFDEVLVIGIGFDQAAAEAEGHGTVGTGTGLEMDIGHLLGHGRDTRVNADVLDLAAFLGIAEAVVTDRGGPGKVVAPDDADLGLARGTGAAGGQGGSSMPLRTVDQLGGELDRLIAGGGLGAHVRRTEGVGKTLQRAARLLRVAGGEENLLGAILFLDAVELLGDGLESLFPGDLLPLSGLTLGIGALHRMKQAVGIVDLLNGGDALGADVLVGIVGALLHPIDLAFLHDDLQTAARAVVALNAVGVFDLFRSVACSEGFIRIDPTVESAHRGRGEGRGRGKLEKFTSGHFHCVSSSFDYAFLAWLARYWSTGVLGSSSSG